MLEDRVYRIGTFSRWHVLLLACLVAGPPVRAAGPSIDSLVEARLAKLGIQPALLCSDATFLRRVHLDLTGRLPARDRVVRFLDARAPDKRARLIDELLASPAAADLATMRWCDVLRVKSEFPINLWPRAAAAYHRWVHRALADGWRYDRFARALLTASGSSVRDPPVNFFRAVTPHHPAGIARAVALTFMGSRIERWEPARREGLAKLFSRVAFKSTSEWKEEIVLPDPRPAAAFTATLPDGTSVNVPAAADPRKPFADWLVRADNRWFARAVANRTWAWLCGRGLVEEPDDLRPDNPPVHPELLAFLEEEVARSGFDLVHLQRLILNSRTYQRDCRPQARRPEAVSLGAHVVPRRLDAEVIIDAIDDVTGTSEAYWSQIPEPFTIVPEAQRTIELTDGSISSPFLELFGRPARDTGLARERSNAVTPEQVQHLQNSTRLTRKIASSSVLKALAREHWRDPGRLVEELYLRCLSRRPTPAETGTAVAHLRSRFIRGPAVEDLVWALINTQEFLYRH
ncbi:MAG: DUF1553 domain-containing protein [Candidatus Riflebacteria bacterium]|nr:DUF1553 domain-containing protein [Candidatus Riflebacteria bacterium]